MLHLVFHVSLVLSCFMFYVCTFPVLFCSTYLSLHFLPLCVSASLIICPALISFTCPSLCMYLVSVLPALCASLSLSFVSNIPAISSCLLSMVFWILNYLCLTLPFVCSLFDLVAWSDCSPVY